MIARARSRGVRTHRRRSSDLAARSAICAIDGLTASSTTQPQPARDRLQRGRTAARHQLLRSAGLGGTADAASSPSPKAQLPAGTGSRWPSADDDRRRAGAAVVERVDVRVPDADAGHADLRRHPARPDLPGGGRRGRSNTAGSAACPGACPSRATTPLDAQLNYQYRAFGVPGLGLKRGLGEDLVVAPYATRAGADGRARRGLPQPAALAGRRPAGRFGLYEAIDYTPARLPPRPEPWPSCVVHGPPPGHEPAGADYRYCWTGRCSGASSPTRAFQASALLLQERIPEDHRAVPAVQPMALTIDDTTQPAPEAMLRVFDDPQHAGPPCSCCPTAVTT